MPSIPEKLIHAGDLTADHLGTRIRVTTTTKALIADVLDEVRYEYDYSQGQSPSNDEPIIRVYVRFHNVGPAVTPQSFDRVPGFYLEPGSLVETNA